MSSIPNIINKNLRLLIRSRSSALIILAGPLVLVLLVGIAFNTSQLHDIEINVYSPSYNELSDSIISQLNSKEEYHLTKVEIEDDCIINVKTGDAHVCMVFPPDISTNTNSTIIFHVDNSRINLVYMVMGDISEQIEVKSTELSKQLTQILLDVLESSRTSLVSNRDAVTTAISSTEKTKSDADSISSSLSEMNVDVNTSNLNITKLNDDLDEIKKLLGDDNNSIVNNVENTIDDLITKINSVSTIESAKSNIQSKNAEIITSVSDILSKLNDLKTKNDEIVSQIEGISITEAETIVSPIKTEIEPISVKRNHWNFLFPTLIALIIMFVGILLSSSMVIRERNSRAYFRNFITPTRDVTFLIGTFLTCLIIILIQLAIILGQGYYILRGELLQVLPFTSIFLVIMASAFIFLGILLGYLFKSEETVVLAAMSAAFVLLFFSNTILPIETIPTSLKWIANYNPFVISEHVLKKLILFGASFWSVFYEFYMLMAYLGVFAVFAFIARELTKRRYH